MREIRNRAGQVSFAPDTELESKLLESVIRKAIDHFTAPVDGRPDLRMYYHLKGHAADDRFAGRIHAECRGPEPMETFFGLMGSASLPVTFRVMAGWRGEPEVVCDRDDRPLDGGRYSGLLGVQVSPEDIGLMAVVS